MTEFFRGWKRKLGVVTLLMACSLLMSWIKWLSVPQNEDVFANFEWYVIPLTIVSVYLLLSEPPPAKELIDPPTMTHDGGPLPRSMTGQQKR